MKLTKLFAILFVLALALFAGTTPSDITVTCNMNSDGSCVAGEQITFSGIDYPSRTFVEVLDSTGAVAPTTDFVTVQPTGDLLVFDTLDTPDTYTFVVKHGHGNNVINSVTFKVE